MSLPEVLLWQRLKGSPQGIAFRKQHPIGAYRIDFYCASATLVIEVDGIAHDMGDRPARNPDETAASVVAYAAAPPPPPAQEGRRSPSPRRGEDKE